MALGALTLTGWALGIPQIVQIRPEWTPMVVNTGIGFILSGIGLFAATLPGLGFRSVAALLGLLVTMLALEELAVLFFDISPALSLPELHRPLQPGYLHPGRMAPNTALCFLLFGIGLMAIMRSHRPGAAAWAQRAALSVLAIGLLGVIGYSLQLEYLYGWSGVVRMAVHTGVGMIVLGIGLRNLVLARAGVPATFDGKEVDSVYRTATLLLVLLAASAGIGGFAFLQSQVELQLHEHLMQMSADRILLFDQIIEHRSIRAEMASNDDEAGPMVRQLATAPQDPATLQQLRTWAEGLRRSGFSSVNVEVAGRRWQLEGAPAQPALAIALQGRYPGWLLWQNGYLLRRALPLLDNDGAVVGTLITEQPLLALDVESAASNRFGETGEMAVCGATVQGRMNCFPQRSRTTPYTIARVVARQPLPMDYALRGQTGTIVAFDYRQHRVLAAYGPIADTGLGLVVKKDIVEIFAPIRQQFQRIVIFLITLLVFGMWLLRRRLQPLLHALENSRAQARADAARFEAAVESNQDAFFILECMRDSNNEVHDLRYVLLNKHAERVLRRPRAEVIGHGMCELLPERRSDGMLATYVQAVQTGDPISEERSAVAGNGQTRWYHLQAVKLGDGLGVTVRDITSARHAANLIRHQAMHDPLTGLTNRAGFELAFSGAIAATQPSGHVTALALLDLDGFKLINDTLGHATGDFLLKEVATRLRNCTRPTDIVARLGGDEFVLVLPNISYPDGIEIAARKLVAQIAKPFQMDGHTFAVTASIGISICPRDGMDPALLLKCADMAMYRAKHAGRNGYALFDSASDEGSPQLDLLV